MAKRPRLFQSAARDRVETLALGRLIMSGVDEAKRDMWENQVARVLNHYQLAPTSFSAGFRIAVINWLRQMFYWLGRAGRGLLSIWLSWGTKLIGELYWIGDGR